MIRYDFAARASSRVSSVCVEKLDGYHAAALQPESAVFTIIIVFIHKQNDTLGTHSWNIICVNSRTSACGGLDSCYTCLYRPPRRNLQVTSNVHLLCLQLVARACAISAGCLYNQFNYMVASTSEFLRLKFKPWPWPCLQEPR